MALSRSVQPSDRRAASFCRAISMFFASAAAGLAKTHWQSTSQVPRLNLSLGVKRGSKAAINSACRWRLGASIEADVSASRTNSSGSPSGSSSRCNWPHSPAASPGREMAALRRHDLHHEIAVVAAAVRDQHHVRLPTLELDHRLEILRGRVFLGAELDVGRMRRSGRCASGASAS